MIQERLMREPKDMQDALQLIEDLRRELDDRPLGIIYSRKTTGEATRISNAGVANQFPLSPEYYEVEFELGEGDYITLKSCVLEETPGYIARCKACQATDGRLRWVQMETEAK